MDEIFEMIQSYLDGTMPAEERSRFEERLQKDPNLLEMFKTYQGIELSMRENTTGVNEAALQHSLQQLRKKYTGDKKAVRRNIFATWQAVAAMFILVAGAAVWFLLRSSPSELYEKYAVHTPLDEGSRGNDDDSLSISAAKAFNAGDYGRSAELLEAYLAKVRADVQMRLALGISYLEKDRLEDAKSIFTSIAGGESALVDKALWYVALTYLKQKQYDQCRMALSAIPPEANEFEKAQSLLKELK